jgi:FkbM family methyltransferase
MNKQHLFAQMLLRAWPFPRGSGRIIDSLFSRVAFDEQVATVRTTDHFEIDVMPNDLIGRHIYLSGEFDRSIVELLCNFSERDDVLLDIGANIGYVSTCFLNCVPDSTVIAVEPQPGVLGLLQRNLARLGRSQIYPFALSDKDGIAWFEIDANNKGASKLVDCNGSNTIKVEMRSAASMFSELAIKRLDLVKIDAEGAEELILRSCAEHFAELNPRAIIFEDIGQSMSGASAVRDMFDGIGYRVFGVEKSLLRLKLIPVEIRNNFHDYVAVSKTRRIPERATSIYGV